MDFLDEVDLLILDLFDLTDDVGVTASQARLMFRERIEIMYALIEADAFDWPDMQSQAVH